jgi:hypothetical protein
MTPCSGCPGQTVVRHRTVPRRTDPDRGASRIPAAARPPATIRCCGYRARRLVRGPSPVPARLPRPPRARPRAGRGRIPDPPPARIPWFWGWAPAAARPPATIRCSAGPDRTARPGDRRAGLPRTVRRRRAGRRHRHDRPCTAVAHMARPWASRPGRTVPGWTVPGLAQVRADPACTAQDLAGPNLTGPDPAARPRTGPAGIRLVRVQRHLARTRAARWPATAAPGRGRPAPIAVPGRHRASRARTGSPPTAARARAVPACTAPGRHPVPGRRRSQGRFPGRGRHPGRHQAAPVPARRVPSPGRTGSRAPTRSARRPVASHGPPARALDPAGLAAVRESPVPDAPVPADSQEVLGADSRALGTRAPRSRAAGRGVRPDLAGTARLPVGRRTPLAGDRGEPSGAADLARVQGQPGVGGDRPDVAGGGRRPASRPRGAASADRRLRGRTRPVCPCAAGIRAWARCRAPAGAASAPAACPRGGGARAPGRSSSPGSRGRRGRRQVPGTRLAGTRRDSRR